MEFVLIPGGSFWMGSALDERDRSRDEGPQRRVFLKPFLMGKYPVTRSVWKRVMRTQSWHWRGDEEDYPATHVSWEDAMKFCRKTNLSLPSEAQWEYAARGGTCTRFYWGEDSAAKKIEKYAWCRLNNFERGHTIGPESVGKKLPNAFGLYDMSGNVWEWCLDWYHESYDKSLPRDGTAHFKRCFRCTEYRVCRGGSWFNQERNCRSANRFRRRPEAKEDTLGFRVVWPLG